MTILGIFMNNEIRTGANRRYLELLEGLAQRGNTVRVIMNSYLAYQPEHFEKICIPIRYKRHQFPPLSLLVSRRIRRMRNDLLHTIDGIDWIHLHSDINLSAALYLKKLTGAKFCFAVRNDDITRAHILMKMGGRSFFEKIQTSFYIVKKKIRERRIARSAELVAFLNDDDRQFFLSRTHGEAAKTIVIPGNIGLPRFTEEWKNKNKSLSVKKLVYAGPLSISKGFYLVLDLLFELKKRGFTSIKLHALGRTAKKSKLFARVKKLGLEDQVIFTGYVYPFPYFVECDLFVYPTLYDSWGDVVMESIFAGCPAIATSIAGPRDLLKYPELLFETGNVSQMADMVERVITDSDYYQKIRDLCASRIPELTFDWVERFETEMKCNQD